MATYLELHDLIGSAAMSDVRKRVRVAVVIKAQAIAETAQSTTAAKDWARGALSNPDQWTQPILLYLLAENATLTVAQITAASDTAVQTGVNAAVDTLLGV